jgi:hypothetical protein
MNGDEKTAKYTLASLHLIWVLGINGILMMFASLTNSYAKKPKPTSRLLIYLLHLVQYCGYNIKQLHVNDG